MEVVGVILGGLGLAAVFIRRTFLGVLIGVQLILLGTTSTFVLAGYTTGEHKKAFVFALLVTLGGVSQLVVGWALAVRLFHLGGDIRMETLRKLRE